MCNECLPVEIHPYEYAQLEREAQGSRVYCGRVLAAAIAICRRESGLPLLEIARRIQVTKTTLYRHMNGQPTATATLYGMLALLEMMREIP